MATYETTSTYIVSLSTATKQLDEIGKFANLDSAKLGMKAEAFSILAFDPKATIIQNTYRTIRIRSKGELYLLAILTTD